MCYSFRKLAYAAAASATASSPRTPRGGSNDHGLKSNAFQIGWLTRTPAVACNHTGEAEVSGSGRQRRQVAAARARSDACLFHVEEGRCDGYDGYVINASTRACSTTSRIAAPPYCVSRSVDPMPA